MRILPVLGKTGGRQQAGWLAGAPPAQYACSQASAGSACRHPFRWHGHNTGMGPPLSRRRAGKARRRADPARPYSRSWPPTPRVGLPCTPSTKAKARPATHTRVPDCPLQRVTPHDRTSPRARQTANGRQACRGACPPATHLVWPEAEPHAGKGVALPCRLPRLRHVAVQQGVEDALDARLLQHAVRNAIRCNRGRAEGRGRCCGAAPG